MTVDLDVLRRTAPVATVPASPRRRGAFFVGAVLLLGALGWAFLLLRPYLVSAKHVMTAPVRVEAGVGRRASAVEATGWLEPDPYPVFVRPLVDGVVESLDVVEGQRVEAGKTVVARLRNSELEVEAEKAVRRAERAAAMVAEVRADLAEDEALLVQKIDLRREVARLAGELARAGTDERTAQDQVRVAERGVASAEAELRAQESLEGSGSGAPIAREKAAAAVEVAKAEVVARRAEVEAAHATSQSLVAQLAVAKEALENPVALRFDVEKTKARLATAEADLRVAETERDVLARQVGLLTVRAPVDGLVLTRDSSPGSSVGPGGRRMGAGEGGGSGGGGGTLVALYDPQRLQGRIDVPLAGVSGVGVGQAAELKVETVPGRTFHGTVTRVVGQADPLKNTLQVKVRLSDPDPVLLRPEMLVRARFLAPAAAPGEEAKGAVRILVPRKAVRDGAVYVVDPRRQGRARRVPVTTVAEEGDDAEVTGDVGATNRVILDPVEDGDRIEEMAP